MDDYNQNDMSTILEKADNLKSLFSEQKAAPEPAAQPKAGSAHLPRREKTASLDERFDAAIARSRKTFRELFDEAVTEQVDQATAHLSEQHAAEVAQIREAAQRDRTAAEKDRDAAIARIKADAQARADETARQIAEDAKAAATRAQNDADALEDLKAQLAEKDDALAAKNMQLADKDAQIAAKEDEIAAMNDRLAEKDAELAENADRLNSANEDVDALKAQLSDAQTNVEDLQAQLSQAQIDAQDLQTQLSDAQAAADDLKTAQSRAEAQSADELALLRTQVAEQQARIDELVEAQEEAAAADVPSGGFFANEDDAPKDTAEAFDVSEPAFDVGDLDANVTDDQETFDGFDNLFEESDTDTSEPIEFDITPEADDAAEAETVNPAADIGKADLVDDHASYRTNTPEATEKLSDDIPWVIPRLPERAKRSWAAETEEAPVEDTAPEAPVEEAPPAPKGTDRKTEEDKNVLEVLRQLSNATPLTENASDDDLFEDESDIFEEETDLFEEDAPVTDDAAAADETPADDAAWFAEEPADEQTYDKPASDDLFADDENELESGGLFDDDTTEEAAPADDFGFAFDEEDLEDLPADDDLFAADDAEAAPAEEQPTFDDIAIDDAEPAYEPVEFEDEPAAEADAAEGLPLEDDAADEAPSEKTGLDADAQPDDVTAGDTTVLDTDALESFFAVSEAEDDIPSILDQKTAEAEATAPADTDTAEAEAAFDDLFAEEDLPDDDAPAAEPDDPFESAEDAPNHVPGDTFNLFNDLAEARRIVNSEKSDEELLAESDNAFESLFEDEETVADDGPDDEASALATDKSDAVSDAFDDLFSNSVSSNDNTDLFD